MFNIQKTSTTYDFYHSEIWIENGILFSRYKSDLIIDLQVAKEILNDRKMALDSTVRPFFNDITELMYIDPPARKYLASSQGYEFTNAQVIYSRNSLLTLISNAYLLLEPPPVPVRVFKIKPEGIRWLEFFKNPN
jgi:hypothetical protein